MAFLVENLRLKELIAVVHANRAFFDEFLADLSALGYSAVSDFIREPDSAKGYAAVRHILARRPKTTLYDGMLRSYEPSKANWYLLAWLLRDAPAQRLGPLVLEQPGRTALDRRASLLNQIRQFVHPLFPDAASWTWPAVAEIMLARLEGSRRALKGTIFEVVVRRALASLASEHSLRLTVSEKEVRLHDETYDVQVTGAKGTLLVPVKTRETMGGGHALLFTRDIHKSISVAIENGYQCLPIVIAEAWGGNLKGLASQNFVYVQANPTQLADLEPKLKECLEALLPVFQSLV